MSKVYRTVFLILFLLVSVYVSFFPGKAMAQGAQTPTVAGTVNLEVNPKEAPVSGDITFSASGRAFGVYRFYVIPNGELFANGQTPAVLFKVAEDGCSNILISRPGFFRDVKCTLISKEEQTWSFSAVRNSATLGQNNFQAVIDNPDSGGTKDWKDFKVGSPATGGLKVTLSPPGPLPNNQNHTVTITWSPSVKGQKYNVLVRTTAGLALPQVTCDDDTSCSTQTIIPAYSPRGQINFQVVQESDTSKFGSASLTIEAVVSPDYEKANKEDCKNKGSCASGGGIQCDPADGTLKVNGSGIMTAIGCVPTEPKEFVVGMMKFISFGAGGIAMILMILGALQMITAEGNPENLNHAREKFYSAIIGLLFIIFSVLLLQVIGYDILGLPGFNR